MALGDTKFMNGGTGKANQHSEVDHGDAAPDTAMGCQPDIYGILTCKYGMQAGTKSRQKKRRYRRTRLNSSDDVIGTESVSETDTAEDREHCQSRTDFLQGTFPKGLLGNEHKCSIQPGSTAQTHRMIIASSDCRS